MAFVHGNGTEDAVIVRMGLLNKRADRSEQDFRAHWHGAHGPLAQKLTGLRKYHQNHVIDRAQRGIDYARGDLSCDGISQLWFDDLPSMQAAFSSERVDALAEDESRFVGDLKLVTAIQHHVITKPDGVPLIKRMSILKRRADIGADTFKREWFDIHSLLVKRLPQVKGYTQNFVFDRAHGRGKPAMYRDLPIDGIVELWFENTDALNEGFASDAGKTLMTHATEFISEISTFLVETHEIV